MSGMLPPLYAAWMEQVLPGPIPVETQATCQQCAMCPPPALLLLPSQLFISIRRRSAVPIFQGCPTSWWGVFWPMRRQRCSQGVPQWNNAYTKGWL